MSSKRTEQRTISPAPLQPIDEKAHFASMCKKCGGAKRSERSTIQAKHSFSPTPAMIDIQSHSIFDDQGNQSKNCSPKADPIKVEVNPSSREKNFRGKLISRRMERAKILNS